MRVSPIVAIAPESLWVIAAEAASMSLVRELATTAGHNATKTIMLLVEQLQVPLDYLFDCTEIRPLG